MRNNSMYTTQPDESIVDFKSIYEDTVLNCECEEIPDFDFAFDEIEYKQFKELIKHDTSGENIS